MSKKRKSKSLYGLFIKNYIYTILIFMLGIIIFIAIMFGEVIKLEDGIYNKKFKEHDIILSSEKLLDIKTIKNQNGWIEKVKDGKIVQVIGTKKDDISNYSLENIMNNVDSFGNKYQYDIKAYKINEYTYIVKIPNEYSILKSGQKEIVTMRKFRNLGLLSVMAIIAIILSLLTINSIKKISRPLKKIEESIAKISFGNLDIHMDFNSYKQIDRIKDSFNYMASKLKESEIKQLEYENSKKRMIRDISHDIKTPITSILGYSKAILDNKTYNEDEKRMYLQYIYDKTKRLNYLVDELFMFSKLDSPEYNLQKSKTDICEFMRQIIAISYVDIEEKNFDIDIDIPDYEIYAMIDSKVMERAIYNLINNALKYNPMGTMLAIKLNEDEKNISISIKDNGIGIPAHISKDIFEEFVRGDKARKADGGSGLGLAITKKIVNLHNGEINIESKEGIGTKFDIKLEKI